MSKKLFFRILSIIILAAAITFMSVSIYRLRMTIENYDNDSPDIILYWNVCNYLGFNYSAPISIDDLLGELEKSREDSKKVKELSCPL